VRIIGLVVGMVLAWALQKWAPQVLATIASSTGFSGVLSAIAVGLTSIWGIAINRLSALEKLDDLRGEQKRTATLHTRRFRNGILTAIAINAIALVVALLCIPLATATLKLTIGQYSVAYLMVPAFGLWLGGFFQSLRVMHNIDDSRIAIAETQAIEKQKAAYLQKLREDERKNPIDRNDAHLNKYRESHGFQH